MVSGCANLMTHCPARPTPKNGHHLRSSFAGTATGARQASEQKFPCPSSHNSAAWFWTNRPHANSPGEKAAGKIEPQAVADSRMLRHAACSQYRGLARLPWEGCPRNANPFPPEMRQGYGSCAHAALARAGLNVARGLGDCTAGILPPLLRARRPQDCRRDGGVTREWMPSSSVCTVKVHDLNVAAPGATVTFTKERTSDAIL